MVEQLKKGDRVGWKSPGGTAQGKLLSRQTHDTHIKGAQVRASRHAPRYIVESDNGGKASHKPAALTRE
jgi:hypothetical protein